MDPTERGSQPFYYVTEEHEYYALCNGEIYNYRDLAKLYGIKLHTGSDCEIIIPLFMRLGTSFVQQLIGVFAFVIYQYDYREEVYSVYAGRDRIGVRPLFYAARYKDSKCYRMALCSEAKGLTEDFQNVYRFEPGSTFYWTSRERCIMTQTYYNMRLHRPVLYNDLQFILFNIKHLLVEAVRCRLMTDRPLCCLLSGGVDSSLITAITADLLVQANHDAKTPVELATFCIGLEGGTDFEYARKVAAYIQQKHGEGSLSLIHTEIKCTPAEFIQAIPDVVRATESFDITTVRASVGQYLLAKWIAKNTDYKVVMLGDGADEVAVGYLGYGQADSLINLQKANEQLVREIHYYDVLRADRGISAHGLEARVPFLDHRFVDFYLAVHPALKVHTSEQIEKMLLRKAFQHEQLLPSDVLFRRKEAFSDGVSSVDNSWHNILKQHTEELIPDATYSTVSQQISHLHPPTKEALYYRIIFKDAFHARDYEQYTDLLPKYWMPLYDNGKPITTAVDPSARTLVTYAT